ncbi:lytic transglycosylase domain-containing protein [Zhongshania sp.]|uniref:lytic transglycosylase domain-containing protein n=1 Tax=Zhongshania sp. TaxID=1971902 RepID=UPI003563990B
MPTRIALVIATLISNFALTSPALADSNYSHRDPIEASLAYQAVIRTPSFSDHNDGHVWIAEMSKMTRRYVRDPATRLRILALAHKHALGNQLPPGLVLAVIETESSFNGRATSRVGARGLMQVMPFWRDVLGHSSDNLYQTETNIRYGCKILKRYLDRENGNISRALARYNGSVGKLTYANKVIKKWRRFDSTLELESGLLLAQR